MEGRSHKSKSRNKKHRFQRTPQTAQEALTRALNNTSTANFTAIFEGMLAKGIPMDQVEPRVNVFTLHAWPAKGRRVRKGEHGVKVVTWISRDGKESTNAAGERIVSQGRRFPKTSHVFHISQTDPIDATDQQSTINNQQSTITRLEAIASEAAWEVEQAKSVVVEAVTKPQDARDLHHEPTQAEPVVKVNQVAPRGDAHESRTPAPIIQIAENIQSATSPNPAVSPSPLSAWQLRRLGRTCPP
jgi:hypothetical protein